MTVAELSNKLNLEILSLPCPEREVSGVYAGDLLSWVMGRADEKNAWATIMTNQNVLAVATLIQVSCVIICEDCPVDSDLIALAKEKQVNLLRTGRTLYEACVALAQAKL